VRGEGETSPLSGETMAGATVRGGDLEILVSGGECGLHTHPTVPHGGLDLVHDGEKMEITKLTIVDGIITELEFTIMAIYEYRCVWAEV